MAHQVLRGSQPNLRGHPHPQWVHFKSMSNKFEVCKKKYFKICDVIDDLMPMCVEGQNFMRPIPFQKNKITAKHSNNDLLQFIISPNELIY